MLIVQQEERAKTIAASVTALLMLSVVGLLVSGCAGQVEEIVGEGPVERFEKSKHWLYVHAKANVESSELYSTSQLGNYIPGCNISEALRIYGTPQIRIPEKRGTEYVVYENDHGVIKLGAESSADGSTSHPLYFIPHDRRLSSFFCAAIVDQIDKVASKQVVMLFESGYRQPHMHAVVEYGQIQEVIFISRNHSCPVKSRIVPTGYN